MIKWNIGEASGTSLRGYLDNINLPFQQIVARLVTLSGQDPTERTDQYKVSVEFCGTFRNQLFTLYDYKSDRQIHIGGLEELHVEGLKEELARLLENAKESDYYAPERYNSSRYSKGHGWPMR